MNTHEIECLQNALADLATAILKTITERVDQTLAEALSGKIPSNNSGNVPIENDKTTTAAAAPLLHDIKAAAVRLSMSVASVRKLIRQDRIRPVPDFRKVLIPESELQRFAACES